MTCIITCCPHSCCMLDGLQYTSKCRLLLISDCKGMYRSMFCCWITQVLHILEVSLIYILSSLQKAPSPEMGVSDKTSKMCSSRIWSPGLTSTAVQCLHEKEVKESWLAHFSHIGENGARGTYFFRIRNWIDICFTVKWCCTCLIHLHILRFIIKRKLFLLHVPFKLYLSQMKWLQKPRLNVTVPQAHSAFLRIFGDSSFPAFTQQLKETLFTLCWRQI